MRNVYLVICSHSCAEKSEFAVDGKEHVAHHDYVVARILYSTLLQSSIGTEAAYAFHTRTYSYFELPLVHLSWTLTQ